MRKKIMVQTVCSYKITAGKKMIVLEKPHSLSRIFFSIHRISEQTSWHATKISFDDPNFLSYFLLSGSLNHFEAEGADIYQGNIWVQNASNQDFWYSMSEILH